MATVEIKAFEREQVTNEWTPIVEGLIQNLADGVDNAAYIGVADEAEAKSVLNKIQRTANGLNVGARRQSLSQIDPKSDGFDKANPWLLVVTIGKKKAPRGSNAAASEGVAGAVAKQSK